MKKGKREKSFDTLPFRVIVSDILNNHYDTYGKNISRYEYMIQNTLDFFGYFKKDKTRKIFFLPAKLIVMIKKDRSLPKFPDRLKVLEILSLERLDTKKLPSGLTTLVINGCKNNLILEKMDSLRWFFILDCKSFEFSHKWEHLNTLILQGVILSKKTKLPNTIRDLVIVLSKVKSDFVFPEVRTLTILFMDLDYRMLPNSIKYMTIQESHFTGEHIPKDIIFLKVIGHLGMFDETNLVKKYTKKKEENRSVNGEFKNYIYYF